LLIFIHLIASFRFCVQYFHKIIFCNCNRPLETFTASTRAKSLMRWIKPDQ